MERTRQNLGNTKRQRLTCNRSKSTPNLGSKHLNSRRESQGISTVSEITSVLLKHVLTTSRALVDLVITSVVGSPTTDSISELPSGSTPDFSMFSGMSSQDCIYMSTVKKATISNPWLIPILQSAWKQVYAWVISLGVSSANVVLAAWRVWSNGVNRLLSEILERDGCGHVIGFEFMDLLQICLVFLNNYLRNNQKEERCVYRMLV